MSYIRSIITSVAAATVAGGLLAAAPGAQASSVSSTAPSAPCADRVQPATTIPIEPCDTPQRVMKKAANVIPTVSQVAWQQRGVIGFTHFGMNTFTDREWGTGTEDESIFAPKDGIDYAQWMSAFRAGGMREAMFTAKHHDGFVLYPSHYTNHSVIASDFWRAGCPANKAADAARAQAQEHRRTDPAAYWKVRNAGGCHNPKADVLGNYLASARRAGLRTGVYMSPADGAELPKWFTTDGRAPAGQARYGRHDTPRPRTIPTLVPGDDRTEAVRSGKLPSFTFTVDDYNAYYLNQIYEVLTEYGPVDEWWLDGANPWAGSGITQTYDFRAIFDLIHALSPHAVIFAGDQGVRWVGNESGIARQTEWSPQPLTEDPRASHVESTVVGGPQAAELGTRAQLLDPSTKYLMWFPAEADVSIRPGWFFHSNQQPKSPAHLVDIYRSSVGRNAVMLLNVPPGPNGKVAAADIASLTSFGQSIRQTYDVNLLAAEASPQSRGLVRRLTDAHLATAWHSAVPGSFTVSLQQPRTFDQVSLGEDITHGQHVESGTVEARVDDTWQQVGTFSTIGYKRILRLDAPVTADGLRVTVTKSRGEVRLTSAGLYRTVAPQ